MTNEIFGKNNLDNKHQKYKRQSIVHRQKATITTTTKN